MAATHTSQSAVIRSNCGLPTKPVITVPSLFPPYPPSLSCSLLMSCRAELALTFKPYPRPYLPSATYQHPLSFFLFPPLVQDCYNQRSTFLLGMRSLKMWRIELCLCILWGLLLLSDTATTQSIQPANSTVELEMMVSTSAMDMLQPMPTSAFSPTPSPSPQMPDEDSVSVPAMTPTPSPATQFFSQTPSQSPVFTSSSLLDMVTETPTFGPTTLTTSTSTEEVDTTATTQTITTEEVEVTMRTTASRVRQGGMGERGRG